MAFVVGSVDCDSTSEVGWAIVDQSFVGTVDADPLNGAAADDFDSVEVFEALLQARGRVFQAAHLPVPCQWALLCLVRV